MTIECTFDASRTLQSVSAEILVFLDANGKPDVDPREKKFRRRLTPRAVWKSEFEFCLDFFKTGNSPVDHGKYNFHSTFDDGFWRVVITLADVVYEKKCKYAVITSCGTLDPAIIIDPN